MDVLTFSRYCALFFCLFFFFNDTATTEIYTLSLHDALPISPPHKGLRSQPPVSQLPVPHGGGVRALPHRAPRRVRRPPTAGGHLRRDPCDRQAAPDGHTLVLDEERPATGRTPGPRHGALLPATGPHHTRHLLALHRCLILQRGRGDLDVVDYARRGRRRDPQETSIGRFLEARASKNHDISAGRHFVVAAVERA